MIVSCPNCHTKYNLSDEQARPGAKLRCTVCKHVFPLRDGVRSVMERPAPSEDASAQDLSIGQSGTLSSEQGIFLEDFESSPKKKKKAKNGSSKKGSKKTTLILLLCFLLAGTAYAWLYTPWLDNVKPAVSELVQGTFLAEWLAPVEAEPVDSPEALANRVKLLEMRNVRQYSIPNEKIGKLTVIEGKVANGFDEPRDLIRLEAALYDKDDKMLVSKSQVAGTSVSLFQLQVLGEKELEQTLNNKLEILSKNVNVAPGAEVPFMVVLFNPPENATDFSVKIVDAQLPEKQ